jgi:hypothetical protein
VQFIDSDDDGGGRWWRSMVSKVAGTSAEAERRARGRVSVRGENGGGFSTARPHVKIRPARARGVAASMADSDQFSGAQRCEHGRHSVTSSVVGGVGPVTQPGR